jgi:serine/threonine-protein kinase
MVTRGEVLGGRYAVERVLGQGGFGLVVAARHIELGQRVAIKMLLASDHHDDEVLRRFERESRAVAELSSEHVARVTDIGTFEDGSPFMVMEYLEGEDLQARIDREGPLAIALAARLFVQAAIGLGDAHEHGVIHRDVKPSNLFLTRRRSGRIVLKVLDFGIAKADDEPLEASMTSISSLIGSPQYMSPEQLCDPRAVDARTDVWALGASFYEAIAGCAAFPADSLPELHMKVLAFEPPRLATLRTDCPPELDRIVHRCLSKDPAQRFSSMSELQRSLEECESTVLLDPLPADSSPFVTVGEIQAVHPPSVTTSGSTPRAGAAQASLRSRFGITLQSGPSSEAGGVGEGVAEANAEGHRQPPGRPISRESLPLITTLTSSAVAALVASVTTYALVRMHAFDDRPLAPNASAAAAAPPSATRVASASEGPCVRPIEQSDSAADRDAGMIDSASIEVNPSSLAAQLLDASPAPHAETSTSKATRRGHGTHPSKPSSVGAHPMRANAPE